MTTMEENIANSICRIEELCLRDDISITKILLAILQETANIRSTLETGDD